MPLFEFQCEKCGKIFDKLVLSGDGKGVACPECGSRKVKRLIGKIAHFEFKGALA